MNEQTPSSHGLLLIERMVHRHGRLGHKCTSSMSATTPIMRRGAVLIMGTSFRIGSVHMHVMVQRIALGKHPLRYALAYNRDQLAAVAIGVVEIASFDDR